MPNKQFSNEIDINRNARLDFSLFLLFPLVFFFYVNFVFFIFKIRIKKKIE